MDGYRDIGFFWKNNREKRAVLFLKTLSLFLAASIFISCSGNQQKDDFESDLSVSENPPRAAASSDYTPFRYFYTRQKAEGLSGWEIAYLLSLGYSSEELTAMDFAQKRQLLLPGITGVSGDTNNYDNLHKDDQETLAGYGMTPGDYEGLTAIGFQNIQWLSREKIEYLLPLEGLRERLEPDPFEESVFFEGYPKLFEDRLNLEASEAFYTDAGKRGLSREQVQLLRNRGFTEEQILTLPEKEINNLLWDLFSDSGREEQLSILGYTTEEINALSPEEEAYIFPFENLFSKLEDDGFNWTTINAIKRDSDGAVNCKMLIRMILGSKKTEP